MLPGSWATVPASKPLKYYSTGILADGCGRRNKNDWKVVSRTTVL